MEREIVGRMQEGNRRDYSDPMLVSPHLRIDTEDRHPELNASQRQQRTGLVSNEELRIRTLVPRQDLTAADRTWAERYEWALRYSRASKETGIGKGAYGQVKSVDAPNNRLTVELQDGTQAHLRSTPTAVRLCLSGGDAGFSVGDRIQFTAPANELKVANRGLGTENIEEGGRLHLKIDGGRSVELDPRKHLHLDHGYAMTSHSSQGQTADRVLIHVDTELGAKGLLKSRMAYVSVSRGRYDADSYEQCTDARARTQPRRGPFPGDSARARTTQDRTTNHAHESAQSGFRSMSVMQHSGMTYPG